LFTGAQGAFVIAYQGCTCKDLTEVRNKLRANGAHFAVVKNTLARRAIAGTPAEKLSEYLQGPTAVVWAKDNLVEPAKIITDFAKDKQPFQVKGGFVDGAVVDTAQVTKLANMPSKKELQAKLLALINAP